uniref:BPI2 domain-containing protein n=1 Tax=Mesocestoides corti TaxID=53468 RepID=A0A5K3G0W8_MESCO
MIRHDIQSVRWMMEYCLSRRPCTSRTTQFYVSSDGDPQYNITITYLQSTSAPNRNIRFSFRLSADVLDLNVTTCIENEGIIMAHRNHGPIRFSDVVIQADVIIDANNLLHIKNSQIGFGKTLSGRGNFDNNYYHLLVPKLATFINEKC